MHSCPHPRSVSCRGEPRRWAGHQVPSISTAVILSTILWQNAAPLPYPGDIQRNGEARHIVKDTQSLQDLFHNRLFRVPHYQRSYAWEQQQVEEFLDDLDLLDSSRYHYTGTIVLYQPDDARQSMDNEGNSYLETDIVDGQQRLTTVVLLLNELSKALRAYDTSAVLADGISRRYVVTADIDEQPPHKLSLNDDTDFFFKNSVLPDDQGVEGEPVMAGRRLTSARKQISGYLNDRGRNGTDHERWLRELHGKITTRLHFNLYEVEWAGEVGVIFEVMNDRGKQLTDLEKVKNYLLYAASSLGVSQDNRDKLAYAVNDAWGTILRDLMSAGLGSPANENQLLRAHWLMEYDPQPRRWDGSKSIRRRFDLRAKERHSELLGELHRYVEGLRASCTAFCDALRPARSSAFSAFSSLGAVKSDVVLWNSNLVRIGLTAVFLPLLMAVRMRWPSEPRKYLEVLKLCEVLAFRTYRVARYYTSYRQPAMFRLAFDVAHGEVDFDEACRQLRGHYGNMQLRRAFDAFTNAKSLHSLYEWSSLRYFLYEYEQHLALSLGGSPKVDWTQITGGDTIEHVLPQSIDNQPYWQERFDPQTHREYRHDIGNLTLTKSNPHLGTKAFPDKKGAAHAENRCYANSLLLVERDLTRWGDWTTDSIDERRARLLGWAGKRWHIDFGSTIEDVHEEQSVDDEDDE